MATGQLHISNVEGVEPFEHKMLKKFPTLTADMEIKFRIL